jgi:hypothetical protein
MRQAADEIEKERAAVDGHIRLIEVLEDEVARLRAELAAERERNRAPSEFDLRLMAQRDKLREALEFYADERNYDAVVIDGDIIDGIDYRDAPAGRRARAVLKETK